MTGHLTGRGVLIWLFSFFGIIIAMNSYFIMVSSRTFRGEDEQKPYLQGVEYNQTLAHHAEQAALGWKAAIIATRLRGGDVRIEIQMRDSKGKPVNGYALTGELRHPSDENRDRVLHLTQAGPGTYQVQIPRVSPGVWDVLIHSSSERAPFDAERRLWLR